MHPYLCVSVFPGIVSRGDAGQAEEFAVNLQLAGACRRLFFRLALRRARGAAGHVKDDMGMQSVADDIRRRLQNSARPAPPREMMPGAAKKLVGSENCP